MNNPLVSVICLCYNHEAFVEEALDSVIYQTYKSLEIIIVDDASKDDSLTKIESWIAEYNQKCKAYPDQFTDFRIELIAHNRNAGNCKSFNEALALAKGKYVIDFATDDVMLDERIAEQVEAFESLEEEYGVVFTNALYINEHKDLLYYHYKTDKNRQTKVNVPSGDVYKSILQQYFICTPTMMMRKSVLEELEGYDEALSYEDFDFWIRSARKYKYHYLDKVTTFRRLVKNSLSTQFYQKRENQLLDSTLKVCEKAYLLNQTPEENQALAGNIQYHLRQSFYMQNFKLAKAYYQLLQKKELKPHSSVLTQVVIFLCKLRLPVYSLYMLYLKAHQKLTYYLK